MLPIAAIGPGTGSIVVVALIVLAVVYYLVSTIVALRSITAGLDRVIGNGLEIFVRVRSTRAPQPAWLRPASGGYEVELVAGEEGVSPGQACVFYDAPSGQARVLGGGFIKSATARNTAAGGGVREMIASPLVEVMRG